MPAERNTSARWKLRTRLAATPPPGQRRRRGSFVETQTQIDSSAPSGRPLRGARADDAAPTELENLLAGGFYKDVAPTVLVPASIRPALCILPASTRTMFTSTRSPFAFVRKLAAHFTNQAARRIGQDH